MASAATSDRCRSRGRFARRHHSESAVLANDAVHPKSRRRRHVAADGSRRGEVGPDHEVETVYRETASE